jgi:hypothetical protein
LIVGIAVKGFLPSGGDKKLIIVEPFSGEFENDDELS